jgi:KaiC/GvpD/RAD55 family RecA-like ATPase
MLDTSILKSLLRHDFYEQNKGRLNSKLFDDEIRSLFIVLQSAHNTYQHDLTSKELYKIWEIENPVATRAEKAEIQDIIGDIDAEPVYSDDISSDIIQKLWIRDLGKRVSILGLELNEGNIHALPKLQDLMAKYVDGFDEDEFGPDTEQDIDILKAELDDSARAKFNIEQLSRQVVGINRQEFGIIFANPNVGKTAFICSLALSPGGFIDQGFKVAFLGNEEATKRTVVRAYSASTGLTKQEVFDDTAKAKVIYNARTQNLVSFKDTQDFDLDMIDRYLARKGADIIFIDQADKVMIGGNFNASHERLRELYRRLRELAKKHNCAIFGVSQASAEAEGRTRLSYTMMEGSKIGKAAEADLILGIGKQALEEEDNLRYITVSKNKISGWHGTITCQIQPDISRYVD